MIITYGTQAKEALDGLAAFNRAAYVLALLRVQMYVISLVEDGLASGTVRFGVDDDTYAVSFVATVTGMEIGVHELDWQVNGL